MDRTLKTQELLALPGVEDALASGKLVLFHKEDTAHPDFVNMYFLGRTTGLAASNTDVTDLGAQLLGWTAAGGASNLRAIQNASKAVADTMEVGSVIDGTVRVVDRTDKGWFDLQEPRKNKDGAILLSEDGEPIYRESFICSHQEFDAIGHQTIKVGSTVGENAQPAQVGVNNVVNSAQGASQVADSVGDNPSSPQIGANKQKLVGAQA